MSAAQVAADLRGAAKVLKRDGWTQCRAHATTGEHCAAGAIEAVIDPDWQHSSGWEVDQNIRFGEAIGELRAYLGGMDPTRWNDGEARTADEVIAALLAAADAAEAPESETPA